MGFGLKKPIVLNNMIAESLNDQIGKTCASTHNGLKAITTKKDWQLPKRITTCHQIY